MKKIIITGALVAALAVPTFAGAATVDKVDTLKGTNTICRTELKNMLDANLTKRMSDAGIDSELIKEKLEFLKIKKEAFTKLYNGEMTIEEYVKLLEDNGCTSIDKEAIEKKLNIYKQVKSGELTKEEARTKLNEAGFAKFKDKEGNMKRIISLSKDKNGKVAIDKESLREGLNAIVGKKVNRSQSAKISEPIKKYYNNEITLDELKEELGDSGIKDIDKFLKIIELRKQVKDNVITREDFVKKMIELKK